MDKTPEIMSKSYMNEQFECVDRYMKAHLSDCVGLYDISTACNMSVSKISSLFRALRGCGPMAYFNSLRIEEAKKLILGGEVNMTRVSAKLGFGSSQYFSKVFKKYVGVTPTEYAKNAAL